MKTPNLNRAIKDFIVYTVKVARDELSKSRTIRGRKVRRVASGSLKASLYGKYTTKGNSASIGFGSRTKYGKMVEYGVNGTRVNYKSPFSYTGESINTDWVEKWVRQKGIVLNEGTTINGFKYLVGRSIARKGIAPVPYFQIGVEASRKKFDDKIFNAYTKDVDKELDNKLK